MKKLIILILAVGSFSSFASKENYEYETETFKGKYTKIGKSFVCVPAFSEARDKAWEEGFSCSGRYRYRLTRSWFNKNKITCTVYADCSRKVLVEAIDTGVDVASDE